MADITVLGDIMLDTYVECSVDRISPEAPVPIGLEKNRIYKPGGAANVAANLRALGVETRLVGLIGDDKAGDILRDLVDDKYLLECEATIEKIRYIANGQQIFRHDIEKPIQTQEKLLDSVEGIVVVSDYAKGTITEKIMEELRGKKVILDPKPKHKKWYKGVSVITPNMKEAEEMSLEKDVLSMGRKLRGELGCAVIITRGSEGVSLFNGGEMHLPTEAREVYDVTGAGDTFIAALGMGLASGKNLEESCKIANIAAGIAVGKRGTAIVTLGELNKLYKGIA